MIAMAQIVRSLCPSTNLNDRVVVIVGAGHGLGQYIAMGLAHYGAHVVPVSRTLDECLAVAHEIELMGRHALPMQVDATQLKDIENLIDRVKDEFGRIDVFIHNAGGGSIQPALEISPESYQWQQELNLRSVYLSNRLVASAMAPQKQGKIINISSTSGFLVRPGCGLAVYGMAKAGVIGLTQFLAKELANNGITINCIAPGQFRTPRARKITKSPTLLEKALEMIPQGRIGEPADIVGPALFFASELSDYVTGQVLFVDGARTVL